ncbi:response regulator [Sphingobium nicotianae]|uniref:Response regulator n=1 Tax=Sphingobium nicotianae TaxID=2782607 RepID=A0A9X1DCA2_9SPHN|nr:response regulator [Sphingobium nicotianae]MBT2187487.1 response regulator [Sphingobium nicotianae]
MHILIIEDDAILAMNLQFFLEELGADTTTIAATEAQAIREAMTHPPDLIASDVELAEGTGPEAVKAIRSKLGDVPVIYVTGRGEELRDVEPRAPIIEKPVKWLELVHATRPYGLPVMDPIDLDATPD